MRHPMPPSQERKDWEISHPQQAAGMGMRAAQSLPISTKLKEKHCLCLLTPPT